MSFSVVKEEVSFRCPHSGASLTLYYGDAIQGFNHLLEPHSIDVIVTSPPYNLGVPYRGYSDCQSRTEYLDWIKEWGRSAQRVLAEQGSLFLNIGAKPKDPWVPYQVLFALKDLFVLQNVIHWIKSIAIEKKDVGNYPGITQDVVVGHYKPINGQRFLNDCHEYIFHLTHRGDVPLDRLAIGVPYQDRSNLSRWKGAEKGVHCRGNTWFIPYPTIRRRDRDRPHPATFPVQLPEKCLKLHGLHRIQRVCDPFLGIGNTAIACIQLGLNFIGFEISYDYFRQACERIEAFLKESKESFNN